MTEFTISSERVYTVKDGDNYVCSFRWGGGTTVNVYDNEGEIDVWSITYPSEASVCQGIAEYMALFFDDGDGVTSRFN